MQYGVAFLFVIFGLACLRGIDHVIGTFVGLSLLIGAALYVFSWPFLLIHLHLIPVRGEDTMVDEWGELWACLRWGAVYAALILGGHYLYDRYNPSPPYDVLMVDETSGITREDAIKSFEEWKATQDQPKP